MHDPRPASALRQILPAHDHRTRRFVLSDMVIDILRDIGFVVGKEAAIAKTEILDEKHIASDLGFSQIGDFDMPQPDVAGGREPERDAMPKPPSPFPDETIRIGAKRNRASGPTISTISGASPPMRR